MKTKIELVDRAYSKLRISGLTVNPNPQEIMIALDELEAMIGEWELKNVCLGFISEDDPNPNTDSGLKRGYENAVQSNLALRLAPEFGKQVPQELARQASQSYSAISSAVAKVKGVEYPDRQPIGEANSLRFNSWMRYYKAQADAPNDCSTEIMSVGDVTDSNVNYSDLLIDGDTISSMKIDSTSGIRVESSSFDDTSVNYRVTATKHGTQSVKIEVTTESGLINNKCNYYSVVTCKQ